MTRRKLPILAPAQAPPTRVPEAAGGAELAAMLAADVARDPALGIEQLVLWQPVASGEQFLTQFLRTQLAAEMLAGGAVQRSTARR